MITSLLLIIIFLGLGYFLGKITCNSHFKNSGIWITIGVFVLINALHSIIDGISLAGIAPLRGIILMTGHEVIRQPILYILFLGMITPFAMKRTWRYLAAFAAVTLVWGITIIIGSYFGKTLTSLSFFDPYIPYLQFLFIGDIIHHIVDRFAHKH